MTNKSRAAVCNLLDQLKNTDAKTVDQISEQAEIAPSLKDDIPYVLQYVDPENCEPWQMANRQFINDELCEELTTSIEKVGQQVPAIVRQTASNQYELIVGARRLFVCKKLGIKLLAAVVSFTDQEALLAMDAENRPRKDLSPYERACDYQNWIEKGFYKNQKEVIDAIGIKKSLFTQLIALASLSDDIVKAFRSPFDITIKNGYKLSRLYKDKQIASKMDKIAKTLQGQSLSASSVYRELLAVAAPEPIQTPINISNDALAVRINKQGLAHFQLKQALSPDQIEDIIEKLTVWLHGGHQKV